jgi:predicted acyl esterase
MRRKHLCSLFLLVLLPRGVSYCQTALAFERNREMQARDGVILRADIYRPAGDGSFPVLLERTPYSKVGATDIAPSAVSRGFMMVVQDVRGRYTSGGESYPFKHEIDDGYDTVEWAAALPRSNGKVGMFGGSYVGATQMLAAISPLPHLAGICPANTASNYHENWIYQGLDWLAHPIYDDYWKQWSIEENYSRIQVPAPTITAWYDIFQEGSFRNYTGLRDHAGNDNARRGQRLLVLIGGHAGIGRRIGEVDFGPTAAPIDESSFMLDWYDHLFFGQMNQFSGDHYPVRIFVMGKNEWRDEFAWPPMTTQQTKYYLLSAGRANSSSGDGSLVTVKPRQSVADSYVYDPAQPVPTVGGLLCCDAGHLPPGPRDQTNVEARSDVLVYSTPPLDHDLEITGPITLSQFAKSSAVDTDLTAKLVDVWPNGFTQKT